MNFEKWKTPMLPKLTLLGYPTVMVESSHKSYMHTHYPNTFQIFSVKLICNVKVSTTSISMNIFI